MSDSSWIEMPKPPCNGSDAVNQPTKTGNTRQSQLDNRASKWQLNVTRDWKQTTRMLHNIGSALTARGNDVTFKVPQGHHPTVLEV